MKILYKYLLPASSQGPQGLAVSLGGSDVRRTDVLGRPRRDVLGRLRRDVLGRPRCDVLGWSCRDVVTITDM